MDLRITNVVRKSKGQIVRSNLSNSVDKELSVRKITIYKSSKIIIIIILLIEIIALFQSKVQKISKNDLNFIKSMLSANRECVVDSAQFEVLIYQDGSAYFTETWNVSCETPGPFCFVRTIENPLVKEKSFESLSGLDVEINGIRLAIPTTSYYGGYMLTRSIGGYEIYAYQAQTDETNTITLHYRLNNIINYMNDDHYRFSYDFLEKSFKPDIDKMYIYVYPASGSRITSLDIRSKPEISSENIIRIPDKVTKIRGRSIQGPFQIAMEMEGAFTVSEAVSKSFTDALKEYNYSACAKLTLYRLPYYVVLFIFYIFVTFVISNADFYAFVKNKNLWGKNIQYGEETKQVKSTIDDLFSDLDSDDAGMQYDYERAIRRSFSYGVENPVSVLFASLLMMAGDGEAELKKNEIRYSSESLMKRKTKLDCCVRDFLNIFHTEYIQERPGWISIRVREILEELESNNEFTLESLDTVLEKTTKIMSSKKVHMSIKERKRGKVLRNRSVFSSGSLQMISLDEMVRSVDKRRLNPEKLFEFLYMENAYRSMREVVYTPSNGDYTVYDHLYAALCIKAVESSNKKKRNSNNSKKDIDYDMFSD